MGIYQQQEYWRENRERLERMEQQKRDGNPISDAHLHDARRQVQLDEANRVGTEKAIKDGEAVRAAAMQQLQERRDQVAQQEEAAFRARVASVWQGDEASLEAAFPAMWQQELSRRTQEQLAATAPRVKL